MAAPTSDPLATGLRFLADRLSGRPAVGGDLTELVAGWATACGWREAGLAWPAAACPAVVVGPWRPEWARPPEPGDGPPSGRQFAPMAVPGRPAGVLWADRGDEPWADAEVELLRLAAGVVGGSAELAARLGPDPDRLGRRLADAAAVAGRLAHEFDNVLTGVIGFADLALPLLPPDTPAAVYVAEVGRAGQRGVALTAELRRFVKADGVNKGAAAVARVVAKEVSRVRPRLAHRAAITADAPADLPPVAMAADRLALVVGPLLDNAVEATPAGGRVAVTARAVELSAAAAAGYVGRAAAGRHVELTVTDTGPGVWADGRPRPFEDPLVTTKVGHRGLGLAVAYRAVAAHAGGARVGPADPGPGTVARAVVPCL